MGLGFDNDSDMCIQSFFTSLSAGAPTQEIFAWNNDYFHVWDLMTRSPKTSVANDCSTRSEGPEVFSIQRNLDSYKLSN